MAVASGTVRNADGTGSSVTIANVTVASGGMLLVHVALRENTEGDVPDGQITVTWDPEGANEPLTKIHFNSTVFRMVGALFKIEAPTAGTNKNVAVNVGEDTKDLVAVAVPITDAESIGTPVASNGTSATSASDVVTSETDGLVLSFCHINNDAPGNVTVGASQTSLHSAPFSTLSPSDWLVASEEAGAASVTMSHSWDSAQAYQQVSVPIAPTATGVPTIDSTDAIDDHSIRVNVTPHGPATSHEFHASETSGFTPDATTLKQTLGATPTQAIATGLTGGDQWVFKLVGINGGSTISPQYADITAPERPTGITADNPTATTLDVTASGGAVAAAEVELYRRVSGGDHWDQVGLFAAGYAWPFTDTGLATGTTYEYRARCVSGDGDSGWSPSDSEATLSSGVTVAVPTGVLTITGLAPTVSGGAASTFTSARRRCGGEI